jgi:uncharacterized OB-fold protein
MSEAYLPPGLPAPVPERDGLSAPYWEGLKENVLKIQRNPATGVWQWPPQWITHDTQSFAVDWVEVAPRGRIYSWTRVWHPVHPALKDAGPYIVVVVELPEAGNVRLLGNLLGDPRQDVRIGAEAEGVFEHHPDAQPPYSLLQWRVAG